MSIINNQDMKLSIKLSNACRAGNLSEAISAVNSGATNFNSSFHDACAGNHLHIVEYLITLLKNTNKSTWNLLIRLACTHNNVKIARYITEQAMANLSDTDSLSMLNLQLCMLCIDCDLNMAKMFIEKGSNDYNRGLEWGCRAKNFEFIKLMLTHGATNVNIGLELIFMSGISYSYSKFIWMLENNITISVNEDIVSLLVRSGANNLKYLRLTKYFNLYKLYCAYEKINPLFDDRYLELLKIHPSYILLIGSKCGESSVKKCWIKKLPVELFRLLFQFY